MRLLVPLVVAVAAVVAVVHEVAADPRPLYYDRAVTQADLDNRTLRELALMRNTIYARAGHQFRKQWLHDYFAAQTWYKPLKKDDDAKITKVDRANAVLIAKAEQAAKPADLKKRRDDILARERAGKATPEDAIELTILNTRIGTYAAPEPEAKPPSNVSPLEDPSQLDHVIKAEQLSNLSRRDLRILRNMVYARHGKQFKSYMLQSYFSGMDWYTPDASFDENKLTKTDITNIRLVKSVETSVFGGPLSDDEQRAEESMSGS